MNGTVGFFSLLLYDIWAESAVSSCALFVLVPNAVPLKYVHFDLIARGCNHWIPGFFSSSKYASEYRPSINSYYFNCFHLLDILFGYLNKMKSSKYFRSISFVGNATKIPNSNKHCILNESKLQSNAIVNVAC